MQKTFPTDERDLGRFCAGLLKENCICDAASTRQVRARKTESTWAADHYSTGQFIARRGDVIDPKKQAAIAQLSVQLGIERKLWWWSGAMLAVLIMLAAAWIAIRRRAEKPSGHFTVSAAGSVTLIPGPASTEFVIAPSGKELQFLPKSSASAPPAEDHWRRRALAAEQRAEQATSTLRKGLLPHLAQWLKHKLVRALFWQRKHLLETQQTGASQIAELEKRLAAIAPKLQQQITRSESGRTEPPEERKKNAEKTPDLDPKVSRTKNQP